MSYPMRICNPGDYRLFTEVAHYASNYNHYKGYYKEQGAENYIEDGKMWCSAPVPLFKEFFFDAYDPVYISFDAKFDNDTDYLDLTFITDYSYDYYANNAFYTFRLYKDYSNYNKLKYSDTYESKDVFNYKSYRKNTSNERHFVLKVVNDKLFEYKYLYLYCDYIQFEYQRFGWQWGYNASYDQLNVGVVFDCNNSNVKISNIIITNTELELNESCIRLEAKDIQTDEYCTYNSETELYTSTEKNNGINITFNSIDVEPTFINCELYEDANKKNTSYFNKYAISVYTNNEEICKRYTPLNNYAYKNLLTIDKWIQPVLTENGTIGVSNFACQSGGGAAADAYKAFDSSTSSYVNYMNPDAWLMFYSKDEIEITGISLTSPDNDLPYTGKFQVSTDDGNTWTDVGTWKDTALSNAYAKIEFNEGITSVTGHYFRFYSTSRSYNHTSNGDIGNVKITAYNKTHTSIFQHDMNDLIFKFNFI